MYVYAINLTRKIFVTVTHTPTIFRRVDVVGYAENILRKFSAKNKRKVLKFYYICSLF